MSHDFITLPSGQKVDVSSLIEGLNTVLRQRINLGDPSDPEGLAAVINGAPLDRAYGVVTRPLAPYNGIPVRSLYGNLVPVPFRPGAVQIDLGGTATASVKDGLISDESGMDTYIPVSVPTGQNGVRIWIPFYGRCFGVRVRRDSATLPAFTVAVDGHSKGFDGTIPDINTMSISFTDGWGYIVTHDDLPDGFHLAEICVVAPSSGTSALTFYGFLAEERAGYRAAKKFQMFAAAPAALTTSLATPSLGAAPNSGIAFRKAIYCNVGSASATLTLAVGGVSMLTKVLSVGDSYEFDFGGLTANSGGGFQHMASVASTINATIITGIA